MSEIKVKSIDFHHKENAGLHRTKYFELIENSKNPPVVILRRGQEIFLTIYFENRSFHLEEDTLRLIFSYSTGSDILEVTKTLGKVENVQDDFPSWNVKVDNINKEKFYAKLVITSPADIPVGNWKFKTELLVSQTASPVVFKYDADIYFLFNPWCSDDLVYMENKPMKLNKNKNASKTRESHLLDEYVINDVGKIWLGPKESTKKGREWIFGQYDACVLPAIIRGDPIAVTREISKLVHNDNDGVLKARWDGQYFDGVPPAGWTGSVDILRQYLETKQPVKYGQCWVFAGVVTTTAAQLSRSSFFPGKTANRSPGYLIALGIPSRVVSNLISAQDADNNLRIDKYYDESNEEIDSKNIVWAFHVWNDVWMKRKDLLEGYDGWQAIDATPTQNSHGFDECGPTPLQAIKEGHVGICYNVGFMLASVNADIVCWKKDDSSDSGYREIDCNRVKTGYQILTKRPFIFDPPFDPNDTDNSNLDADKESITYDYKYKEGTKFERNCYEYAIKTILKTSRLSCDVPDTAINGLDISLTDLDEIKIGEPFSILVSITNNSDTERTFKTCLSASSYYYTGVKAKEIVKSKDLFKVRPKSSEKLCVDIKPKDYMDKLVEYGIIKFYAILTDTQTNKTWVDEDDFYVTIPSIDIEVPDDMTTNIESTITLKFKNPLDCPLTNCKFYVAGPGLAENKKVEHENIPANKECCVIVRITPTVEGNRKLVATFTSAEIVDITGSTEYYVT